jgi:hypothetical protein
MRTLSRLLSVVSVLCVAEVARARAPDTFEEDYKPPIVIESPMRVTWEFRTGPYRPAGSPFHETFNNDNGWLFATELDITLFDIPKDIGQLAIGLGAGWSGYSAKALVLDNAGRLETDADGNPTGRRSGETTKLQLYPLNAMGVVRIDALARHTVIPVTFAGKLGADFLRWKSTTGSSTDAKGLNIGLRWAVQAALELDFIDRRSARRLDDEFGINHTLLFVEWMQSRTQSLGDRTLQFGLSIQF